MKKVLVVLALILSTNSFTQEKIKLNNKSELVSNEDGSYTLFYSDQDYVYIASGESIKFENKIELTHFLTEIINVDAGKYDNIKYKGYNLQKYAMGNVCVSMGSKFFLANKKFMKNSEEFLSKQ